jgi:predicted  nucleic acid-binding Zn-ribbon protein
VSELERALERAEALLARLDERRDELERLASAGEVDGEAAVELVAELAELAKEIEGELARAREIADAST